MSAESGYVNPRPPAPQVKGVVPPIDVLRDSQAQAFRHVQPAILFVYYVARFPYLVADPVRGMTVDLAVVALIQCAYATICLPPNGWISKPGAVQARGKGKGAEAAAARKHKEHKAAEVGWPTRITTVILSLILTAVLGAPMLYIIIVLFGAPITTHHAETFLCAAHMALLSAFPLFYTHGVRAAVWMEVLRVLLPFDEVWGAATGTMLGAWIGAVPIPLDWDRDWQRWPITITTGAYMGCLVGKYIGEYLVRGKRVQNDAALEVKPLGSVRPPY